MITGMLVILVVAMVALSGIIALNWSPDRPLSTLTARWAPPPSIFLPLLGVQVHLRDQGLHDSPIPIILIHGTSASLHTWEGWVSALEDRHRIITFDLPAFGLTGPSPDADYTIAAYVRFVGTLLDKLGIQRCVLGGNSLGGNVAWETTRAMPDRIDKLIFGRLPSQLNINTARISARPVARAKSFYGGRDTAKLNRSELTRCLWRPVQGHGRAGRSIL